MTRFALHPGLNHMPSVTEEDMIWHLVKRHPWDLFALLSVLLDFAFFWTFGDGLFMASQTYFNLRKARKGLFLHILVARDTLHALFLMGLMVKLDGLLHPSPHDRVKRKDHYQSEEDDSSQKKPKPFSLDHGRNQDHPVFTFSHMAFLTTALVLLPLRVALFGKQVKTITYAIIFVAILARLAYEGIETKVLGFLPLMR